MNTKPKLNHSNSSTECFQAKSLTATSLDPSRNTWNSCSVQLLRDASSNLRLAAPRAGATTIRSRTFGSTAPMVLLETNGPYSNKQECAEASPGSAVSAPTQSSSTKSPTGTLYNTGKLMIRCKAPSTPRPLSTQELWEQALVLPTPVQDRHTKPFHVKPTIKSMLLYICSVVILVATLQLSNL